MTDKFSNPVASIITIGDELLIGQVIDTNSAWIAQQLNKAGIEVRRRVAVGDSADAIRAALDEEAAHSNIILMTGGLGPTADDITKAVLCEYFESSLRVDKQAHDNVRYLFEVVFRKPVTERNLRQAEVPADCVVIQNRRGSAPGMMFEKSEKVFISMPGVPHEMKGMLEDVIPLLTTRFEMGVIIHCTLVMFGIGESAIADMIQEFENSLPPEISLAYLPNYGQVRLRLTARSKSTQYEENIINQYFTLLKKQLDTYVIAAEDMPMELILSQLLKTTNTTIATAESCTGGYIAHLLTSRPGASAFYAGSVVTYSYKAKEDMLHVSRQLLEEKGAVSEEVVSEMARGCLKEMNVDYVIAVSGIMGPEGGTTQKPVGTVWIAVANAQTTKIKCLNLKFDRERNIQTTAIYAMNMMRAFILETSAVMR